MKIESILVPVDFSEDSERALEAAIEFAKTFGARIELVHAFDFGHWVTLADVTFAHLAEQRLRLAAEKKIHSLVDRARARDVDVSTHLELGTPSDVITRHATQINADLIVMGTRGLGALKHLFLGSVAERTIQTAPCPVLTVAANFEKDSGA